ncbi:MAG: helix-turn-helix domain-containing protein, partial [Patescibacteria group bacterium]
MSDSIPDTKNTTQNDHYISMLEASKLCSYSQEYLSLLARRGKIVAKKIGRNWFIAKSALDEYLQKQSIVISLPKSFFTNQNIPTDFKSEKFGRPAQILLNKISAGKPILVSALTPEEPEVLENGDQPHSKLYEEFLKLNKQKQEQNLAAQPTPVVQPVQPITPKIELPNRPQPEAVLPSRPTLDRLPSHDLPDHGINEQDLSKADVIIEAISNLKVETEMQDQREEKIVQTLDKLSDSISLFAQKVSEKPVPAPLPIVVAPPAQLPPELEEFVNDESQSFGYRLRHTRRYLSNIPRNPSRMTAIIVSAITLLFVLVGGFSFGNADQIAQLIRNAFKDADTLQGYFPGTHANEVLVLDKTGKISIFGHIETQGQLRSMAPDGVAPIVVDSMTKIENLNADYFDDLDSKDFTLAFVTKNGNVTYEDVKLEGNVEIGKTLTLKGPLKLLDELNVYGRLGVFADAYFSKEVKLTGGNLNVQKGDILLGQGNLKISQGTIEITNPTMVKNLNAELLQGQTPNDITQGITLDRVVSNGNSTNKIAFFNGGLYGGQGAFATIGVAGNASFGSSQNQSATRFTVFANNFSVDSLGNVTNQATTTTDNLKVTNGV